MHARLFRVVRSVILVVFPVTVLLFHTRIFVSAYRYIATTNLPIIPVYVEYLRQFLIDFNQIYRHSSVPKNTSPGIFPAF